MPRRSIAGHAWLPLLACALAVRAYGEDEASAVFVQPFTAPFAAGFLSAVYVSGGAQFSVSPRVSVTADAAVLYRNWSRGGPREDELDTAAGVESLGVSFNLTGTGVSGFFVTPKVYFATIWNRTFTIDGPAQRPIDATNSAGGAGVDLAWQSVWHHFFFGVVLGVGCGWEAGTLENSQGEAQLFVPLLGKGHFIVSFNFNLLRIGYAF